MNDIKSNKAAAAKQQKIIESLKIRMIKYIMNFFLCSVLLLFAQAQEKNALQFTIHLNQPVQKVRNIGASGCWFTEEIGATWPADKKQRIAEVLFSKDFDANGQPKGIGSGKIYHDAYIR